jgi:hypothetical protein
MPANIHRVDCVPLHLEASREPVYSLWLYGRQLVPQTSQPMVDAKERLQRLGYEGFVQLWFVDKPWLFQIEPLHEKEGPGVTRPKLATRNRGGGRVAVRN